MVATFDSRRLFMTYTAPSLATFRLYYDELNREGSKKSSINEILDSDESAIQIQGNRAERYPIDVYFVGEQYDLLADGFWTALSDSYSQSDSGTLVHPRWGLLNIIPIKWKQSESFVKNIRRANFTVEFIRADTPSALLGLIGTIVSQVVGIVELLGSGDIQAFIKGIPLAVQALGDTLGAGLDTVKGFTDDLLGTHAGERDIANNIFLEADSLLDDIEENADLIVGQIQEMMRLPMEFEDVTFSKINAYNDIIAEFIIQTSNIGDVSDAVRRNKAQVFEQLAGYAVAAQNAAALSTEFRTRSDAISAIETLKATYKSFTDALNIATVESSLEFSFSGDHEFLGSIHDIHTKTINEILNSSFSLAGEARIVLTEKSDPITLCYKHYKKIDIETLNFFFESNLIKNSEFVELDAGREVVFYVA